MSAQYIVRPATERREFPAKVKVEAFKRANGHCVKCTVKLSAGKIHYDHRIPDQLGGEPTLENCDVLCTACHGEKTAKIDVPAIAKAKRREANHISAKTVSRPMPGSRASNLKRKMNGKTVPRYPSP